MFLKFLDPLCNTWFSIRARGHSIPQISLFPTKREARSKSPSRDATCFESSKVSRVTCYVFYVVACPGVCRTELEVELIGQRDENEE